MTFLETNRHTGEGRLHTEASLRLRLSAIRVPLTAQNSLVGGPGNTLETEHGIFSHSVGRYNWPFAMATGAWGLDDGRPYGFAALHNLRKVV